MPLITLNKKPNVPTFYLTAMFSFIFLLIVIVVLISDYYEFDKKFSSDVNVIKTNYDFYNNKNEIVLEGLSAFIASAGAINDATLNRYAKNIQARFPHIYGLEIAKSIKKEELNELISHQKRKGYKNFSVKEFDYEFDRTWKKLSDREIYLPLVYIYPLNEITNEILGLDLISHKYLGGSFERSVQYGGYQTSMPFTLIEGDKAFIMFKVVEVLNDDVEPVYMSLIVITAKDLFIASNEIDSSLGILLYHNSKSKSDLSGHFIAHNIRSDSILPYLSYSSLLDTNKSGFILNITKQFQIKNVSWILLFVISLVLVGLYFITRGMLIKNKEVQNKLEKASQQKYKMKALSNLTGGIAHEFNNNLSVTRGFLSLLSERNNDKEVNLWLRHIGNATEKSIDLTRKLLTYSRYNGIRDRVSNILLTEEINKIKVELSNAINKNIELKFNLTDCLYPVLFSEVDLKEILLELVINASDAIGDSKGLITISTKKIHLTSSNDLDIEHNIKLVEGDYILLSVSDNGAGVDDEIKPHIFDPFFTTKGMGNSSGMGLASVYGLVKLAKGYILSSSNMPKGCVLNIYLPILS